MIKSIPNDKCDGFSANNTDKNSKANLKKTVFLKDKPTKKQCMKFSLFKSYFDTKIINFEAQVKGWKINLNNFYKLYKYNVYIFKDNSNNMAMHYSSII